MIDQDKRSRPYPYIMKALKMFRERGGKIIVEIGCMRQRLTHDPDIWTLPCCNDGHSTALLSREKAYFWSVDIEPEHVVYAREAINKNVDAVALVEDGIEFLSTFKPTIDLLYLDAWDANYEDSAAKHLNAYLAALPIMAEHGLILIDDTDVDIVNGKLEVVYCIGGKGKLVVPQAIIDGWQVLFSGRQTLLSR